MGLNSDVKGFTVTLHLHDLEINSINVAVRIIFFLHRSEGCPLPAYALIPLLVS